MYFWRWFLFFCLQVAILSVGVYYDYHLILWTVDTTKLTFVIIAAYMLTTLQIGVTTYKREHASIQQRIYNAETGSKDLEPLWFRADAFFQIGMIGTVIGFMLALGFASIGTTALDLSNPAVINETVVVLVNGIRIALLTTLAGLICGMFTKMQLLNLEKS